MDGGSGRLALSVQWIFIVLAVKQFLDTFLNWHKISHSGRILSDSVWSEISFSSFKAPRVTCVRANGLVQTNWIVQYLHSFCQLDSLTWATRLIKRHPLHPSKVLALYAPTNDNCLTFTCELRKVTSGIALWGYEKKWMKKRVSKAVPTLNYSRIIFLFFSYPIESFFWTLIPKMCYQFMVIDANAPPLLLSHNASNIITYQPLKMSDL